MIKWYDISCAILYIQISNIAETCKSEPQIPTVKMINTKNCNLLTDLRLSQWMMMVMNQDFWHWYAALTGKYKLLLLWRYERGYNKLSLPRVWFGARMTDEPSSGGSHIYNGNKLVRFLSLGGLSCEYDVLEGTTEL